MKKSTKYLKQIAKLIDLVCEKQEGNIEEASRAVADTLIKGGTVYTFGTGHSHLLAEEIFYRAGGLVRVYPIQDEPLMLHISASRSSKMERLDGYAKILINQNLGIKPGDTIFIFSNSGRNTVSIDMAILAKEKDMQVICVTNLNHAASVSSRHPSGKLLHEISDIVIDNMGQTGDASIEIGKFKCGPTSTAIGAAIIQAIVCGAVEIMNQKNVNPEIFLSGNIDGGDIINQEYINKYSSQIKVL